MILIPYIFGFCRMLWQPFQTLLTKEPKDLCFSVDKNIAQSIQCTASSECYNQSCCNDLDYLWLSWRIALMKAQELLSWKWFCSIKYFWLEYICLKQLVDDTSPKPWIFSYFATFLVQYFHTGHWNICWISVDIWSWLKVVLEVCDSLTKKV